MVELILGVVAALVLALGVIWIIGACEPVFGIRSDDPAWFVALRGAQAPRLAPGVQVRWSGAADFLLIGGNEPYWSRFYILAGGKADETPIALDVVEDVFVARISMFAPPAFALGMLRAMCKLGILGKPKGDVIRSIDGVEFRKDVMPNNESIAALLTRPPIYSPTMVNFLAYHPEAKYTDGRASRAPPPIGATARLR
ncbi:MAG: hypothetical protein M0D54_02795 [Hyphomonadaceae bacterium JAD_PAG50586_4]|nr:MAG: hypothetical protein M0D54_02795 [Hyphomonadaceae bacterium JAD_PAG50586_4]